MKTDKELKREVEEELSWEPSVHTEQIGVSAKEGIVQLDGEVRSFAEKYAAEQAALRVEDVAGISSEIKVVLDSAVLRTDEDIARAAVQALHWNQLVPKSIKVEVSNGWLTLTGEAEWRYQAEEAETAVRTLRGIKGVTNAVLIKPKTSSTRVVRQKIEKALKRSASIDAGKIKVEALGGAITLWGNVRSWAERDEAERAAWSAPGTTEVKNLITVGYRGVEPGAPED